MRRRVAVTGVGAVTPLGTGIAPLWEGLLAGRSGIREIRSFDASGFPSRIAGEVTSPASADADPAFGKVFDFALAAAREAWTDAGLGAAEVDGAALVAALGAGVHHHREVFAPCGRATGEEGLDLAAFERLLMREARPAAASRRSSGGVASRLGRRLGLRGPILAVDTACAAGAQAIGDAARWIRSGRRGRVLAGAADSQVHPLGLAGFCLLRVLSCRNDEPQRASRPFDRDRDGFVLGEGAAFLVLEEWEGARRRGAPIRAELVGFGASSDAWRATDPHPEGRGAVSAMRRALRDAGVAADSVGYLNAHGTATPANDRIETRAVRRVFGPAAERLAVSSTKSAIGHLTEAAGAVEAVVSVLSLQEGAVHPTQNLEHPDPECDLDYVPGTARTLPLDAVMSSSFGFGGQCATLVFSRP